MILGRRQFGLALAASLAATTAARAGPSSPTDVQVEATPSKPVQDFYTHDIAFLGEQDGEPESALKDRLTAFFASRTDIVRAYLVRVRYPDSADISVALALRTDGAHTPEIVAKVNRIFAGEFSSSEHLDIMFVDTAQEGRVAQVCHAFFPRGIKP